MSKDVPLLCFKSCRSPLILHYASFILLYVPIGVSWYWGDLVVYLTSYWYMYLEYPSLTTPWLLSIYITTWSVGFILASHLVTKVDRRIVTLLGVLLFDAGLFSSYFSVQHSITAINFTLGILIGAGVGFIQAEVFTRVAKLVTGKTGIVFASLSNCYNIGAMINNVVITWYTNPDNVEADVPVGRMKVFNDKNVIDRVPSVFILLGIIASFCHIPGLGLSLILNKSDKTDNSDESSQTLKKHESISNKKIVDDLNETESNINIPSGLKEGIQSRMCGAEYKSYKIINEIPSKDTKLFFKDRSDNYKNVDGAPESKGDISGSMDEKCAISGLDSSLCNEMDLSPWEALKTLRFYILWFTIFATDTSFIILFNFYKIFGELWISDDHFLTNLAMVAICAVILMRFLWGIIIDKLTVKTAQIIFTMCMSLSFFFYFFTPQVSRWLFAVWTIIIATFCSAVYLNFPVVTLRSFGRSHFGSNYGLVATATIVLNLGAPLVLKNVIRYLGWYALFMTTGVLNAVALVANIFGLPESNY